MNNQILAVWGSPGAGKTTVSLKIARELALHKKNVVVLLCDLIAPSLQMIEPKAMMDNKSLGNLLSLPSISQEQILKHSVSVDKSPYISLLGYKNGDNSFSYAKYSKERAIDLIILLRHIADAVIIDCSSLIAYDVLSTVALENADAVLRLLNCDLKSLAYSTSYLPLIADSRFNADKHIKVLSDVRLGQDSGEYFNVFKGADFSLPHSKELAEQFYSAKFFDEQSSKDGRKYKKTVRELTAKVFGLEKVKREPAERVIDVTEDKSKSVKKSIPKFPSFKKSPKDGEF